MSTPDVKICGLQTVDMCKQIYSLPVDYVGFVLAKSRRQVDMSTLREMVAYFQSLPANSRPLTVGVFVNPEKEELRKLLADAPLDVIQLHGQESPEFCRFVQEELGRKVFKVLPVTSESTSDSFPKRAQPYADVIDVLMLDTYDPVYGGGSGVMFNWEVIPMVKAWAGAQSLPLWIAGGLDPDNVKGLLNEYAPDGVDVSSGVEIDGVKDIQKMKLFVERVKQS